MSLGSIINTLNTAENTLTNSNPLNQSQAGSLSADGFTVPATFAAGGAGLPFSNVQPYQDGVLRRNIITWFIPDFGTVKMYVNPQSISYSHKKLITKDRTKGGYTLQYWGEDLDQLNISGTTGGSGIEGINALYEIYRAEQYGFDATGLSLAASNYNQPNLLNSLLGTSGITAGVLGNAGSTIGALGSVLGLTNSSNTSLVPNSINSLAQSAFTVEMYYGGWVFRGFFDSMTVNERADNFLLDYQIVFYATQRRGYRTNFFPWSKSASQGPSSPTTPPSFSGYNTVG